MPPTPARHARELEQEQKARDTARKANEDKYTEFYMGCEAGSASACTSLGEWWAIMRNDFTKAAELYTTACIKDRFPQACLNLGNILSAGRGPIQANEAQAVQVYGIGCQEGNTDSCIEAAKLILRDVSRSNQASPESSSETSKMLFESMKLHKILIAENFLRNACDEGNSVSNAKGCGLLSTMYLSPTFGPILKKAVEDDHIPKPEVKVMQWLHKACEGEHANSCMALANIYRHGSKKAGHDYLRGVKVDLDKAYQYEKQALVWAGMSESQAEKHIAQRKNK